MMGKKPYIFKFFDFSKGGTDIVEQKISQYTCKAKSVKWKMVAFYFVLDIAIVNASTMRSLKTNTNPRNINSFEIGFDLAMSLVLPQVSRRAKTGLNKAPLQKISIMMDEAIEVQNVANDLPFPKTGEQRKNCKKCLHDIAGNDYKSNKAKLPKNKAQC